MDKDFGAFLFVEDQPHCGLIRLPDVLVEQRFRLMEQILASYGPELTQRGIVTVRGDRIRISRSRFNFP
jgi:hypothetical protein